MKKYLFIALALFCSHNLIAHNKLNTQHIIELGKYYSSFMFTNEASKELVKNLGKDYDENLSNSVKFVKEATKSNNKILSNKFLKLPDTTTLKVVYIIDALHQNPNLKAPKDPAELVDSLKLAKIPMELLVDEYYQTIFASVGNKNKPFDMSKINFSLADLGLSSDRLKAIFYLRCMDMCGSQIYGYMNIANPPNTKKAMSYIEMFPQFNGLKYHQYSDLQFEDFQMEIFNDKGLQSYKKHFINELFKTLLSHAVCLKSEKGHDELQEFLLGSQLKNETLWQFTEFKDVLESIFQEQ